jgi:hypothetical protein
MKPTIIGASMVLIAGLAVVLTVSRARPNEGHHLLRIDLMMSCTLGFGAGLGAGGLNVPMMPKERALMIGYSA